MGRRRTTGVYDTRGELVEAVMEMMAINMSLDAIARRVGVSHVTVANIYNEEIRKPK